MSSTRTLYDLGLGRRTLIMGVLNVTPDSFSDGGLYADVESAVQRALVMLDEGADVIDIGGESTRPATFRDDTPLDSQEEMRRVLPVIEGLQSRRPNAVISIDTYKSEVARHAVAAGAAIVNDISALTYDPSMAAVVAESGADLILMHMPGPPRNVPISPEYVDVVADVAAYLATRALAAEAAGIDRERIVVDPGIGFGKTAEQSRDLIRRLGEIKALGYPVLSGVSRKSFLAKPLDGAPPTDRLEGSAAAVALSIAAGADIVRVHDIREMVRVVRVSDWIVRGEEAIIA